MIELNSLPGFRESTVSERHEIRHTYYGCHVSRCCHDPETIMKATVIRSPRKLIDGFQTVITKN
jgi:hypothetical protein